MFRTKDDNILLFTVASEGLSNTDLLCHFTSQKVLILLCELLHCQVCTGP